MFNNLSLEVSEEQNESVLNKINSAQVMEIASYLYSNGTKFSNINSFADDIKSKFFIAFEYAKIIIIELLQIRNVCANLMNLHATISYDINGNPIYNTDQPQNLNQLKELAFNICNRDFDKYPNIYNFITLSEVQSEFDIIIDNIISYSVKTHNASWGQYKLVITTNYNYDNQESQLN